MGIFFDLELADGRKVTCRVHGNGGEIGASILTPHREEARGGLYERLAHEIERATGGKDLACYEPEPGHVKGYIGPFKPSEAEETVEHVDLRGAKLLGAHW